MLQENREGLIDGAGDIYHVSGAAWRRGYKRILSEEYLREAEIFLHAEVRWPFERKFMKDWGASTPIFLLYGGYRLKFSCETNGRTGSFSPNIKVYHHGFGSTKERSAFSLYYGLRNALVVYWKNMPFPYALFYIFHHMLFFGTSICFHAFFTSPKMLGVPFGFLRMIPGLIRKRSEIRKIYDGRFNETLRWMNRGWFTPFRKK